MADLSEDPIAEFERDCVAAGVSPVEVLQAVGHHRATWFRWKKGKTSPTLKAFASARDKLDELRAARPSATPQGEAAA